MTLAESEILRLQKKFPEYPSLSELDKMQGPGDLQSKAKEFCEQVGAVRCVNVWHQ